MKRDKINISLCYEVFRVSLFLKSHKSLKQKSETVKSCLENLIEQQVIVKQNLLLYELNHWIQIKTV